MKPFQKSIKTVRLVAIFWFVFQLSIQHAFAETGVTLNLKDADIQSFIETVAEITGKNFVIDPRVKAKVTVVSARPMDRAEIYQVFLSVLQVHGFATWRLAKL